MAAKDTQSVYTLGVLVWSGKAPHGSLGLSILRELEKENY
jgi:hypothetical protein